MSTLDRAISTLNAYSQSRQTLSIDARVQLVVTLCFIVAVLSVPLTDPGRMVWMFAYPIVMAEAIGVGYLRIAAKSLWVLPLIVVVGVFNPIIDTAPMWEIKGYVISRGWVTLVSIVLRGLLAFQALLILVESTGFKKICYSLQSMGCPKALVTQLMLLYRYVGVLLTEAQTMHRARVARAFGRKSYPLRLWGEFIGQLLLRSVNRAKHIHMAMLARGFNGNFFISKERQPMTVKDLAYLCVCICVFAAMRILDLSEIMSKLI